MKKGVVEDTANVLVDDEEAYVINGAAVARAMDGIERQASANLGRRNLSQEEDDEEVEFEPSDGLDVVDKLMEENVSFPSMMFFIVYNSPENKCSHNM